MLSRQAGSIDVVVIGAGHSGLAMSRILSENGIEHVVLDRGQIGNSWRSERWDSLRLLTPNWLTRLPGYAYQGDEPDGYLSSAEFVQFLENYARWAAAPVVSDTTVSALTRQGTGYRVATTRGDWQCRAVVLATGACNQPRVPRTEGIPKSVEQLHAQTYRNPEQLAAGRVLVVGGSATGLQLARELQHSGRPVTLAVGEHVRMPRVYRGRDIQWWLLASGLLDRRIEDEDDPERARRVPSPQLMGARGLMLDLNLLRSEGVEVVGRLVGIRDGNAQFSGALRNTCTLADLKLNRMLAGIDEWLERRGRSSGMAPAERFAPTTVEDAPRLALDLADGVRTVLWATGYRPDYSWLEVEAAVSHKGELRHDRGIVDAPGLYALGLPYLRRRKSSFIHGAEDDARELAAHLVQFLESGACSRARSGALSRSACDATLARQPPKHPQTELKRQQREGHEPELR